MGALRKIPKWGWVTGGLGLALVALLLYEHYHNAEETDTEAEPVDASQYPPHQMSMPSGAAGGTSYYLPLTNGQPPAQGATEGLPETVSEETPPNEQAQETVHTPPPPIENEPIIAPPYIPPGGPGVSPGHIAPPGPVTGPAVGPGTPAPSGWCGHPNAVPTGNPCVNGGAGPHTAPPGYHLFCCNGMLGRAPNS
jgi:hypothetical protein